MTEKRFVESGMAGCGNGWWSSARFLYWSMTTSNYRIHLRVLLKKCDRSLTVIIFLF
jgi:hypothetical protein